MYPHPDKNPKFWTTETDDHQFWSFQYSEHLKMLAESLQERGLKYGHVQKLSLKWLDIYVKLIHREIEIIEEIDLVELKDVKTQILKQVCDLKDWIGTTQPSTIDHMIREVEFMQRKRTARRIIALWLTDMCGHAAIDAAMIDPVHKRLFKKAQEFVTAFEKIKTRLGQKGNLGLTQLFDRLNRPIYEVTDWLEDEVPKDTDVIAIATEMLIVQKALTKYHLEYLKLFEIGKLLTTMKIDLMKHTIRESYRAEFDLELIINQ